jgi:hypothetical protein
MNIRSRVPDRASGLEFRGPADESGSTRAGSTGLSSTQFTVQSWWNAPSYLINNVQQRRYYPGR